MISRCIELSMGRGRDRKLKGSKRALMCPHVLHFTWDLSWPWKRSTTMERFLRRWFSHACAGRYTNTVGFADYNTIVVVANGGRLRLGPPANQTPIRRLAVQFPWQVAKTPDMCKSLASCVAATAKKTRKVVFTIPFLSTLASSEAFQWNDDPTKMFESDLVLITNLLQGIL